MKFVHWIISLIIGVLGYWYVLAYSPLAYAATPHIKIVAPTENQTVIGNEVTVSFIVGELQIGKEGHLHLWLDTQNLSPQTAAEITTHFDYALSDLPPGPHTLTLELVKPDHTSFVPQIVESTSFTIRPFPTQQPSQKISSIQSEISDKIIRNWKLISLSIGAIGLMLLGVFLFKKSRTA